MDFLKNLVETTDRAVKSVENAFENIIKVPANVQKERIDTCKMCEHLTAHLNRCELCGCFMDAKTWLPLSSCPDNKWQQHIIASDAES